MAIKFSDDTTRKFIREYKKNECLWNFHLDAYKNKRAREDAYVKMQEAMNIPGLGVLEIKGKIRNLRSTYIHELKKIEESKTNPNAETIYVPSLIWFEDMKSFLLIKKSPVLHKGDVEDARDHQLYKEEETEFSDIGDFHIQKEEIEFSESSLLDESMPTNEDTVSSSSKRKKVNRIMENYTDFRGTSSNILDSHVECEFDIFGKHVATQLKRMSTEQALLAMEQIQSFLTQYRLQDLHKQEVLI